MKPSTKIDKMKLKLKQLQQERMTVRQIFYDDTKIIAGYYGKLFIRCGQPTCRCHKEGGHFATRLSRWVGGKLKSQIVKVGDRDWVKQASDRYKLHKAALRNIQKINSKEAEFFKRLIKLKTIKYR